jgi:hypothetical protein
MIKLIAQHTLRFVVTILVIGLLSACGTAQSEKSETDNVGDVDQLNAGENSNGNKGIVAGSIEPSVKINDQTNNQISLTYQLKNQTERVKEFTFLTSQKYEYELKTKDGNVIKRYSEDKDFLQVITKMTLKQGETFELPIKVKDLKPGEYQIMIWLTSEDINKYKVTVPFEIK